MNGLTRAKTILGAFLMLASAQAFSADAPDAGELTKLLHEFLAGATVNDAAVHDRFWAEELVYTSSSGERFGKAQIMEGLKSSPEPSSDGPSLVYSAEDIRIQQYGDTAIVAFMLLGTRPAEGAAGTSPAGQRFYNTGTFLRRNGTWQVVAWQATRIPQPAGE